jgi:hypothetical protein
MPAVPLAIALFTLLSTAASADVVLEHSVDGAATRITGGHLSSPFYYLCSMNSTHPAPLRFRRGCPTLSAEPQYCASRSLARAGPQERNAQGHGPLLE